MPPIRCQARLFTPDPKSLGAGTMLSLPTDASVRLPSRGMVLIQGSFADQPFRAVLEPDGEGSHWFKVPPSLLQAAGVKAGDTVPLEFEPDKQWPEPTVPSDLQSHLEADKEATTTWKDITAMARWDWIRWIGATRNPKTRQRRIEVACSKLRSGQRRACCFDRNQCTLTDLGEISPPSS